VSGEAGTLTAGGFSLLGEKGIAQRGAMPPEAEDEFEASWATESAALSPEECERIVTALTELIARINVATCATEWPGLLRRLGMQGAPSVATLWIAAKRAGFSLKQFGSMPTGALFMALDARATALEKLEEASTHRVSELLREAVSASGKGGRPIGIEVNGQRLKELRGDISQEALAVTCNVSTDTIYRGERGARWTDDNFEKVANGLTLALRRCVTPEDLKN